MPVFAAYFPRLSMLWNPEAFLSASPECWWPDSWPHVCGKPDRSPNMSHCAGWWGKAGGNNVREVEKDTVLKPREPTVCGQK